MKVHQLIEQMSTTSDMDSQVRISLTGEDPVVIRGVAVVDGQTVLLAVPDWKFSELEQAMTALTNAVDAGGRLGWDDVYQAQEDHKEWRCREHGLLRQDCLSCQRLVVPGWHRALDPTKHGVYCNCHSRNDCSTAPPAPKKAPTPPVTT